MVVCVLVSLLVSDAEAETRPRILLLRPASAEPQMARRLQVEFTNLGIAVIEAPDELGPDPTGSLNEAARREGAFAAVRVVSGAGEVTVWVADRITNKTLVRTLTPGRGEVGGEVVALEVVELLRASLLELKIPEPSRQPPSPEVGALFTRVEAGETPPTTRRPARLHADLGPTVLVDPGGVGPSGHAEIGLRYTWWDRWSSRAFVVLPVTRGTVRGPEGRAEVSVGLLGIELDFALTQPSSDWVLRAGPAVGLAQIRTAGSTSSSLLERADTVYTALPLVATSLERRLSARVGLGLRLFGGMSFPRAAIFFGDRQVAHWGRPLTGASLTLDLALD
jgi:hypothetical protein